MSTYYCNKCDEKHDNDHTPMIEGGNCTPYHEHDCDRCAYLGSDDKSKIDYYICRGTFEKLTLIARFGEYGEYSSGACFYWQNYHLNRAGNLAMDQDLLTIEELQEASKGYIGLDNLAAQGRIALERNQ